MKRNINKLFFGVLIAGALISFYACTNNHKEGDGHNHDTPSETSSDEHEEENAVTLTDEQIKTVGIEIGSIEQKQLSATMKANGFLRVPNTNKANATSLFGGIIKTLNVDIGDYVKKGQAIATISNPQFIQLQEEYLTINSGIVFAEQELTRQRDLNEGNVGAKKNLQSATTELNTLRTRKASLQQQIQLMGINPTSLSNSTLKSSLTVTSPINGIVSNVFAKIGSYVDVSSPIAELVENSALHLDLQVFEKDVPLIKVGQKIDFIVTNSPNKTYTAEVYNIGSSFNSNSKTIAVHSKVIGDKIGLIDGMNITGIVNLDGALSPSVPNEAIVNADGKYYIFLVKEKEEEPHEHKEGESHDHGSKQGTRFEKIEVMKGATELGYTAIIPVNKIAEGTHVVVKGAFFVNAKLSNTGDGHAH
ncbi:efflux RND transporter periplasmic adaptor subunit [Flavobacterium sp. UBA6135]|uniref:efflux RND transporter periplasmic adaptor subunit n=1 Tax=Flavobacterium sp. UBA6135 TaxID=1946553 RepID=UPI0025C5A46C|nr:efflux RND transporter periplasmic adaptor subunit [Flavobacterium sp. UBA6135]